MAFQIPGRRKSDRKIWEFEGWISRVAYSRFLSLKCSVSSGEVPEGAFVFVNYQVIDQNTVITRRLELDSSPEATSQQIERKCVSGEVPLIPIRPLKDPKFIGIVTQTEEQPFQPYAFHWPETTPDPKKRWP